jgi:UDP-2-acetamido-3-amino-2,3-dideoxy-glucuronate N-acetyltransferase
MTETTDRARSNGRVVRAVANGLQPSALAPGLLSHPTVSVADDAWIGGGVMLHERVVVESGAEIHDGAVVGKPRRVAAHSTSPAREGSETVIAPGAAVLTGAVVFAGASIGTGAIVGDQANLREGSVVGPGSVVGRGTAIDNDVTIGARVRIQTNCYLTAYSEIGDDAFIGPGVVTTNDDTMARLDPGATLAGCEIGRAARVGGGVVICPGVSIGEEAFVAAGAVVTKAVEPRAIVMGVPARVVGRVPDEDLLERRR